ncbi:MAG: fatty acid desaturase [Pseudomonadales bacterium]|nr:fatty acid desaturase [Pseudomonadales bacterium]
MKVTECFSREEIQDLCQRSNLHAWFAFLVSWGIIVFAFWLVAFWPNPLTVLVALMLLGGRQLGLAALMHECGHGSLFKTRALNQSVGKWLAAAPVFYRIDDYMKNHLKHHAKIGSREDPDLSRYERYPVSASSFRRKIIRDLTGRTTWNYFRIVFNANKIFYVDEQNKKRFSVRQLVVKFHAPIIANIAMIIILTAFANPWLYLLWLTSYFSCYMVFSRIRNLAEHAVVPELFNDDPVMNTRTTIPSWWERLTFAPNSVCYHLEHHLMPSVPKYRLAHFHNELKARGFLDKADIADEYFEVVRKLVVKPEVQAA